MQKFSEKTMRILGIFRVELKRFSRVLLCFRIPPFSSCRCVASSKSAFGFWSLPRSNPKSASTYCPRISSIAPPMQASFTLLPLWYVLCHPPLEPVSTSFSCVYKPAKCSSVSVVFLPCLLLPSIRCATLRLVLCLFLFLCRTCSCTSISIHHRTSFVSICAISLPPPSFHQFPLILYYLPHPPPPFGLRSFLFTSVEAMHIILIPSFPFYPLFLSSHSPQSCSIIPRARILFHLSRSYEYANQPFLD